MGQLYQKTNLAFYQRSSLKRIGTPEMDKKKKKLVMPTDFNSQLIFKKDHKQVGQRAPLNTKKPRVNSASNFSRFKGRSRPYAGSNLSSVKHPQRQGVNNSVC